MKKILISTGAVILLITLAWVIGGYSESKRSVWNKAENPETVQMLKRFVAMKKAQAYAATNEVPPEVGRLFKFAERGDWLSLSNAFWKIGERNGNFYRPPKSHGKIWMTIADAMTKLREKIGWNADPDAEEMRLRGTPWESIKEVWGAFDNFVLGEEKYSAEFGREIIDSIPAGSIYFGGTDPGRFIVTAMCQSQPDGIPFFILTQNALADSTYLDYLRAMYGRKIYIPTPADSQDRFQEYVRIKSIGSSGGHIALSGQDDVMGINGLLVKTIFEHETNREFFIEESFPLDWMYPHLEPHGLIFKINRESLTELSDEVIQRDRDYWRKLLEPKIGSWLTNETSVETAAAFVKKIFLQRDFAGFSGDARFVQNEYTCKMFSKERSSIAGLYAWRVSHSNNDSEKKRLTNEADFAFRQAWVLCPYAPEATYRYINFLLSLDRFGDAILIAETSAALPQNKNNKQMVQMSVQLKKLQMEHPPKSDK